MKRKVLADLYTNCKDIFLHRDNVYNYHAPTRTLQVQIHGNRKSFLSITLPVAHKLFRCLIMPVIQPLLPQFVEFYRWENALRQLPPRRANSVIIKKPSTLSNPRSAIACLHRAIRA